LEQEKGIDGAVKSWTFASPSLKNLLEKISVKNTETGTYFSDATGYKNLRTNIYAVQENFMDAIL